VNIFYILRFIVIIYPVYQKCKKVPFDWLRA